MHVVTADFDGSGAVQYLRPDIFTAKEIRLVAPDWTPYVGLSNVMTLSTKLTITVPADVLERDFEARQNLQTLRENIRMHDSLLATDDIRRATEDAIKRLREREAEPIDEWAARLSRDISSQSD